jgi:hypothetical protein
LYYVKTKQLETDLHESRGHCKAIPGIYNKNLNGWFTRVFKSDNTSLLQLKSLFLYELPDADDDIIRAIDRLTNYAENYATDIMVLIEKAPPDLSAARDRVNTFYRDTSDLRTRLNQKIRDLTNLRDEFIEKSASM